jgi:uncharacterized protein YkwD
MPVLFSCRYHPSPSRYLCLISQISSISVVLLSLCLLLATYSCEAKDPSDTPMFSRNKILSLVNKARQAGQYCGTKWYAPAAKLKWDTKLEAAAKEHSMDMYENNFFSHKGSNGLNVDDRLYTQHYFWAACGENVAYGALYEDDVINEWMKSPGHCENIMNPAYTEMGVWVSGMYWTQVLAKPKE